MVLRGRGVVEERSSGEGNSLNLLLHSSTTQLLLYSCGESCLVALENTHFE
jgi:hypothetical protein